MKKFLLVASMFFGGLLSAQTYPFYEGFDGVSTSGSPATGALPTGWVGGVGTQFKVYGIENLQPHGWSAPNACSVEMNSSNQKDSLTTPAIGPISGNTKISLSYRFVDKLNYPSTGHQLATGDAVTIDAFVGTNSFLAIASIDMTTNPAPLTTWTTYTYTNALFAFAGTSPCKLRLDVAWGSGDWYLDIDNVIVADVVTGIQYDANNPPAIAVSPNPSHDNFWIWVKNYQDHPAVNVKIYDSMGKLVKTVNTSDAQFINQYNIDVKDLARGMYTVEVNVKNEVSKTKIILE